jgi:nondiscriminating glutamyl-tRNA synthetase
MPLFDAGEIQNAIFDIQAETGVRGRKLYMPIRIGTTRKSHGPELAASVELLGRKKALAHLEQTLTEMKNLK